MILINASPIETSSIQCHLEEQVRVCLGDVNRSAVYRYPGARVTCFNKPEIYHIYSFCPCKVELFF